MALGASSARDVLDRGPSIVARRGDDIDPLRGLLLGVSYSGRHAQRSRLHLAPTGSVAGGVCRPMIVARPCCSPRFAGSVGALCVGGQRRDQPAAGAGRWRFAFIGASALQPRSVLVAAGTLPRAFWPFVRGPLATPEPSIALFGAETGTPSQGSLRDPVFTVAAAVPTIIARRVIVVAMAGSASWSATYWRRSTTIAYIAGRPATPPWSGRWRQLGGSSIMATRHKPLCLTSADGTAPKAPLGVI